MIAIIDYHYGSMWTKHDIFEAVFYIMMDYYHSVLYYLVLACQVLCRPRHLLDHDTIKYVNNLNEAEGYGATEDYF